MSENTDLSALSGAIGSVEAENDTATKARRVARGLSEHFGDSVRSDPDDDENARIRSQTTAVLAELTALYEGAGADRVAGLRAGSKTDAREALAAAYEEVGFVRETDDGETVVREPVRGSIGPHLAPAIVYLRNAEGVEC